MNSCAKLTDGKVDAAELKKNIVPISNEIISNKLKNKIKFTYSLVVNIDTVVGHVVLGHDTTSYAEIPQIHRTGNTTHHTYPRYLLFVRREGIRALLVSYLC